MAKLVGGQGVGTQAPCSSHVMRPGSSLGELMAFPNGSHDDQAEPYELINWTRTKVGISMVDYL